MFNPDFVKLEDCIINNDFTEEIPCGIIIENDNPCAAFNAETFNPINRNVLSENENQLLSQLLNKISKQNDILSEWSDNIFTDNRKINYVENGLTPTINKFYNYEYQLFILKYLLLISLIVMICSIIGLTYYHSKVLFGIFLSFSVLFRAGTLINLLTINQIKIVNKIDFNKLIEDWREKFTKDVTLKMNAFVIYNDKHINFKQKIYTYPSTEINIEYPELNENLVYLLNVGYGVIIDESDIPFLNLEKNRLATKYRLKNSLNKYKIKFSTNFEKCNQIWIFLSTNKTLPFVAKYISFLLPIFMLFGMEYIYYIIFKKYIKIKNVNITSKLKLDEV